MRRYVGVPATLILLLPTVIQARQETPPPENDGKHIELKMTAFESSGEQYSIRLQGRGPFPPESIIVLQCTPLKTFTHLHSPILRWGHGPTPQHVRARVGRGGVFEIRIPGNLTNCGHRISVLDNRLSPDVGLPSSDFFLPFPSAFFERIRNDIGILQRTKELLDLKIRQIREHVLEHGSNIHRNVQSNRLSIDVRKFQTQLQIHCSSMLLSSSLKEMSTVTMMLLDVFFKKRNETGQELTADTSDYSPRDISPQAEQWKTLIARNREITLRETAFILLTLSEAATALPETDLQEKLPRLRTELDKTRSFLTELCTGPFAAERNAGAVRTAIEKCFLPLLEKMDELLSSETPPSEEDIRNVLTEAGTELLATRNRFSSPLTPEATETEEDENDTDPDSSGPEERTEPKQEPE